MVFKSDITGLMLSIQGLIRMLPIKRSHKEIFLSDINQAIECAESSNFQCALNNISTLFDKIIILHNRKEKCLKTAALQNKLNQSQQQLLNILAKIAELQDKLEEQCNALAIGRCASAEGCNTRAIGNCSHAEGCSTTAYGDCSHSEGSQSTAIGKASHSEGCNTSATGECSHAEGDKTTASGAISHAEGSNTTASGTFSHAEGDDTKASGVVSHAEGDSTKASGNISHAEGDSTEASGGISHAEGFRTVASGTISHAEGIDTAAGGEFSHAEGSNTEASGEVSHAEGDRTKATGENCHAEGRETSASGIDSHAEGRETSASGGISHAEGFNTTASGDFAHSEGVRTLASGIVSHAEGSETVASEDGSHAEGGVTTASGNASHAEGTLTTASGISSHAEGNDTDTNNVEGAHIMGRSGDACEEYAWHMAGGTLFTRVITAIIRNDGNACFQSVNTCPPCPDYAEMFETLDGKPIDVGYFVTLEGDKIRKATSRDDYILGITSSTPAILGGTAELGWKDKFIKDEWGRFLYEKVTVPEVKDKNGNVFIPERTEMQKVLNPEYDESKNYISRTKRPEWVPVGMLGQILVRDDGSCIVNNFCRPNDEGIATSMNLDIVLSNVQGRIKSLLYMLLSKFLISDIRYLNYYPPFYDKHIPGQIDFHFSPGFFVPASKELSVTGYPPDRRV